jgi:hypothetical protein
MRFVNLDAGGSFGIQVIKALQSASQEPNNTIDWLFDSSIQSRDEGESIIINENAWGVVLGKFFHLMYYSPLTNTYLVTPNATADLQNALVAGISSYNPENAIIFFYASARNQITVDSHVVSPVLAVLNLILGELGAQHTVEFLQSVINNTAVLSGALKCTQCLASPYGMTSVDLILYDVPEAAGSTMVGLIFIC